MKKVIMLALLLAGCGSSSSNSGGGGFYVDVQAHRSTFLSAIEIVKRRHADKLQYITGIADRGNFQNKRALAVLSGAEIAINPPVFYPWIEQQPDKRAAIASIILHELGHAHVSMEHDDAFYAWYRAAVNAENLPFYP